jgi:hypothetical protein
MIIGYIHVCQKGEWKRSFNMLMSCIKSSGLYDKVDLIRIGILSDNDNYNMELFDDSKFNVVYKGKSEEYERPTLLHMHQSSFIDHVNTKYFYLHTKGIRHFGTREEKRILDWINLMLYWNIEQHEMALNALNEENDNSTYGCNYVKLPCSHYSGNFWWCTSKYCQTLPNTIGKGYTDPEFWIWHGTGKKFAVFSSNTNHYSNIYPRKIYANKPEIIKPLIFP